MPVSNQTPPNQSGYDYAIYDFQATSIFPSLTFPNGANITTAGFSDLIVTQPAGFTSGLSTNIMSMEVDNASPALLYFPSWNLYIQPFTTGYAMPVYPPVKDIHVQATLPRNLANVTVATIAIRLYSFMAPQKSPGAGNAGIEDAVLADNSGFFILSVLGSQSANAQPNGVYVANGYDFLNPDGTTTGYAPARTPNVWVWSNPVLAAGGSTINVYNPPSGNYIRLMCYALGIDSDTPGDRLFLVDTAGNRLTPTDLITYATPAAVSSQTYSGWHSFPGAGRKLGLNVGINASANMANPKPADILLGLYVGP